MTTRKSIHSVRDDSGSNSPTTSRINQTGSRSPQRAKIVKEIITKDDENDFESEDDAEISNRTTSDKVGYISMHQIYYTPESAIPPRSPRHEKKELKAPRQELQQSPKRQTEKKENNQNRNLNLKLIYAIICILPVIACSIYLHMKLPELKSCGFEKLRQRPPLQTQEVWNALKINIELLLNKRITSPNIYLFLHTHENNGSKMQKLIQDIALETSKCFDGHRPIEMSLQDFEPQNGDDYGYPIEQYKNKLKEGNVFLIVNLNDIPPKAARALHTICETHSPIDPDVVIFLTLRTHLSTAGVSPTTVAYQTLQELWMDVPDNELGALITRVTDQVLLLQD